MNPTVASVDDQVDSVLPADGMRPVRHTSKMVPERVYLRKTYRCGNSSFIRIWRYLATSKPLLKYMKAGPL